MSEKHQMPGYRPSALGAATKVRIGEPGIEISAYSVVTIIGCWRNVWRRSVRQLRNYIPWTLCSISLATCAYQKLRLISPGLVLGPNVTAFSSSPARSIQAEVSQIIIQGLTAQFEMRPSIFIFN
jgi:hypothetical protein